MRSRRPLKAKSSFPKAKVVFTLAFIGVGFFLLHPHLKAANLTPDAAKPDSKALAVVPTPKPIRIGLQAGHWKSDEVPDELWKIRVYSTGTEAAGINEWEVDLDIANLTAAILRKDGYEVDVLPATIPENYTADAFVSIHADGNEDTTVTGYKVGASIFEVSGKSESLRQEIEQTYGKSTGMYLDPNVTDDMTEYYAFNYNKYIHTISEKTPAVIVEVGFLTNYSDRKLINDHPEKPAAGIAAGLERFFEKKPQ